MATQNKRGVKEGKETTRSKVEAATKRGGKVGKQARLAMTLGRLRKRD